MFQKFQKYLNKGNQRTSDAKKNIFLSIGNKGLSILINLLIVPITINYINPTQYGIWLTISSIVGWISFFDFGFAHGFRNKFAEARANLDNNLAQKYVSTIYAILTIIFFLFFLFAITVNYFISWSDFLNLEKNIDKELTIVFAILISFFCIQMVLNVVTTLLLADHKTAFSSFITTVGQILALLIIYLMTIFTSGSLVILALVMSGIPCLVLLFVTFRIFTKKYKEVAPSIKSVDFRLTSSLLGLGSKFFVIQLSMLIIFQFINIILSRIIGPEAVTEYNIAYKYFSVLYMFCLIVFNPFWSAFTDAYTKKDYPWMNNVYKKLSTFWYLTLIVFVLMLVFSSSIYKYWIGSSVHITFSLSLVMGIYILALSRANLYMYLINGTGKVLLQMIVYLTFAIISIPLMVMLCKNWGVIGIVIVPIFVFVFQSIIGHVQMKKLLNNTAKGIWNR